MGTHPIFESDFDCLTDEYDSQAKMSGEQMTCKGTLKGHNGWITQIATTPVFPDMLLSASRDKTIIMWQLTRDESQYGIPKRRLNGHSHFVSDVVISSDGQFCLSGSWDGTLRLWDLASGNTTRRFIGHTKDVLSVAFSADNRQIVSAARDRTIKLWNTLGICNYTIQEQGHTEWVSCVRFSPLAQNPVIVSYGCSAFHFYRYYLVAPAFSLGHQTIKSQESSTLAHNPCLLATVCCQGWCPLVHCQVWCHRRYDHTNSMNWYPLYPFPLPESTLLADYRHMKGQCNHHECCILFEPVSLIQSLEDPHHQ